ncbi:MAG TPA: inorganic phosphate transporter [Anaerolineales bacterium]|nr:inorganic phosphate transporter [Anaerolineales bacterium]
MPTELALILLLVLALFFDFLNGFHDSANVVATIISSRAMSARAALWIAALGNFAGPFLFGVAIARTIGADVVDADTITITVLYAALAGASAWNLLTWRLGIPSSSSHALIGGILGAVLISSGFGDIKTGGLVIIAITLFTSPIIGFLVGVGLMRLTLWLARGATPRANLFFKSIQIPTAIALALSNGTNGAQKTMGVITLGLVVLKYQSEFRVPFWVTLVSAAAIALGTAAGGWRIIRTLGGRFYRIRPVHSFASQLTSGLVITLASLLGGPVSTTQVVSSSILGVGAGQRVSQVRWNVLKDIFIAWLLTVPASGALSVGFYLLFSL